MATLLAVAFTQLFAQEEQKTSALTVNGSIQGDVLFPQSDAKIGTEDYSKRMLSNVFVETNVLSKYVDAGVRMEYLKHPLPGYEKDLAGKGIPYYYIKGKFKNVEVTAGTFYEQFGLGFILRTYEERSLGIDNSLLGGRVVYTPLNGLRLKALVGKQRRYWAHNDACIWGTDAEYQHNIGKNALLTLGASFVSKREKDEDVMVDATHRLNLPERVNAFDFRVGLHSGKFNVLAEYAQKSHDPSFDNGYIYRHGQVVMLSASYSQKGMSALLQAKRSEDMAFRSRRTMTGVSSFINHQPAFAMEHTYALAALYPYATRMQGGEWAYQAELAYMFKRRTLLGGKYGTRVKLHFSHIHAIDGNHPQSMPLKGSNGNGSAFWKWGSEKYYQDANLQIEKKLTSQLKLNLMYMNQFYNKTAVEGSGGMIHSNIFVADAKYMLSPKISLRGEVQYLTTSADERDWAFGLVELSFAPHWMLTVSDLYNCGGTEVHYYQGQLTYSVKAHRIQLGYGRTRAGYNCSGGVCRYVPASKGFALSYNYNF
ncbi:MAG TPA: DUF6029 family protein [Prevotella sp.]